MCWDVCTGGWRRVAGHGAHPVDGVDNKVLLQGEVCQADALWAVDDEHDVQRAAALLAVWDESRAEWWESRRAFRWRDCVWPGHGFFRFFPHHNNHTSPSCMSWHHSPAETSMWGYLPHRADISQIITMTDFFIQRLTDSPGSPAGPGPP